MIKDLTKSYNVALIVALLLLISLVIAQFYESDVYRRFQGIMAWLINLPLLITGTISVIISLRDLLNKEITLRMALRALPMTIISVIFTILFLTVIIKSFFV